jgi:two-component system NtrC family response regulator
LPPLRERRIDILPLADHFLQQAASRGSAKRLTAAAADRLTAYAWPGNVRELRNLIERVTVLVRGDMIEPTHLDLAEQAGARSAPADAGGRDLPTAVAELERAMIEETLAACGGNRAEAARQLKINRQLLYAKMERYGLADEVSAKPTDDVANADTKPRAK